MDIYRSTVDYLSNLTIFKPWPEAQTFLERAARLKPRDWQLPVIAAQAAGGSVEQALPAIAAIACAQLAIIFVDDMLDEDPRGEYHRIGSGKASNFAVVFQAAAIEALLVNEAPALAKLRAVQTLNTMVITTAFGQDLDIQNAPDEAAYWRVVEHKSAPFYGACLRLGALLASSSDQVADGLEVFGRLYGEMIQIHDDLNDTMSFPAGPDWTQDRSPLPILFARLVNHPERAKFLQLCAETPDPQAVREAQGILIRSGAVSYCLDQLVRRHRAAQLALDSTPLIHRHAVESLLDAVIEPVRKLFTSMGKLPPFPVT